MFQYLENLDTTRFGKFYKILLAPIWLIQEYICFKKYWKIILAELIENDSIFEFLDRNDFGLENNRLIKKEPIDSHEFLKGRKLEECKEIIKKEYISVLFDLISKNCNINIEEFVSLIVNTDIKIIKDNGNYYRHGIYEVIIQYCRLWWYEKAKKYTIIWSIVFVFLMAIIYLLTFWK